MRKFQSGRDGRDSTSAQQNRKVDRRVQQVWEKLAADPNLRLEDLAEGVGLSVSRLQHLIRRDLDTTVSEYRRQIKQENIRRAARLIRETDERLKQIRLDCGFNDASNFAHEFKRCLGISPREYRERAG